MTSRLAPVYVMFLLLVPAALPQPFRIRSVRPPIQHSSSELIDAALAAGRISSETALIDKVFAAFGDCRLPAEFAGNAEPPIDSDINSQLIARFSALSADGKETLRPFLLAPGVHGSWVELPTNCVNQNLGKVGIDLTPTVDWEVLETENNKATVRYQKRFPEDASRAATIKQALDFAWTKLTAFFGTGPKSDEGAAFGDQGDGRLDIYLSPIEDAKKRATEGGAFHPADCSDSTGYISINTAMDDSALDDRLRVAHELTHAIVAHFKGNLCTEGDYLWLDEATATWGEHYVYSELFTRRGAAQFLADPSLPLETWGNYHQYGAYLFLFYLETVRGQPALIRQFWENASESDSLVNIDGVLSSLGGLKEVWPNFVLYNWNRDPVDDYHRLDPLPTPFSYAAAETTGTKVDSDLRSAETRTGNQAPLRHLSAQYFDLQPFIGGPSMLFLNGWTYEVDKRIVEFPGADRSALTYVFTPLDAAKKKDTIRVQALVKVNGQWQKGAQDWTNKPSATYCRDKQSDRIDEAVVIVSNSEFHDRSSVYQPTKLALVQFESNIGCAQWNGTADVVITFGSASLTQHASDLNWTLQSPEPGQVPVGNSTAILGWIFVAHGTVAWKAEGTYSNCSYSGSGTTDASAGSALSTFNFLPMGSSLYRNYFGVGIDTSLPKITQTCPDTPTVYLPVGEWFASFAAPDNLPSFSADGKRMSGNIKPSDDTTMIWNFVARQSQ